MLRTFYLRSESFSVSFVFGAGQVRTQVDVEPQVLRHCNAGEHMVTLTHTNVNSARVLKHMGKCKNTVLLTVSG